MTVAQALVTALARRGVRRMFGVPGGGSSLDVIEEGARAGIDFVLARTENAAVMMAAVTAELGGAPGVALTTKGPGLTNGANGVAYAALDRAPVLVVTDGFSSAHQAYVTHQAFDQQALLAPIVKAHSRLEGPCVGLEIERLLEAATTPPFGPVHVELTSEAASAQIDPLPPAKVPREASVDEAPVVEATRLLAAARRPVIVVGLEARAAPAARALRSLAAALACPVLPTYKAKGVMPDSHAAVVGMFTGGTAERDCVARADLILLVGLDPVELILQPWAYSVPVIDVALVGHPIHYVRPAAALHGPLAPALDRLTAAAAASDWSVDEMRGLREAMRARLAFVGAAVTPQAVVETARAVAAATALPRITIDAGAHMFSVMAFWEAREPCDVLISNGLATMAFALPAAVAAALHEPARHVLSFTGDGGLLMCLGELATAVQHRARMTVVVFNDGSLSLIDIKQQHRGLPARGVRWPRLDFAAVAEGFGARGWRVATGEGLATALADALRHDGPGLIDVLVDPSGYRKQLRAMRG